MKEQLIWCAKFLQNKKNIILLGIQFLQRTGRTSSLIHEAGKNAGYSFHPIRWFLQKNIWKKVLLRNSISPEDSHVPFRIHKALTCSNLQQHERQVSTLLTILFDGSGTALFCNCHQPYWSLSVIQKSVSGSWTTFDPLVCISSASFLL